MSISTLKNYIDGFLQEPVNGHYLDNFEPATGQVYSRLPNSDISDLNKAVLAAEAAFPDWSQLPASERAKWLTQLADLIADNHELLAQAESKDTGKPIKLARAVDIQRARENLMFFAHAATQFSSESHAMAGAAINYTLRQPLGVVACISPWNLPLYLLTWKIAPALAAGNTVIAKPSEITPMTAYLFSKLCIEAGLPAGVLNIVHGSGQAIGAPLTTDDRIKAISFTGGSATGVRIKQATVNQSKKLALEMGGKNPMIVFADCDFDRAVESVCKAAFSNQGQICLCGSRIYIEHSIYERFTTALKARIESLKVGDPTDESVDFGALVSAEHLAKVQHYLTIAQAEGGEILYGGSTPTVPSRCQSGYFLQPTLITNLPNNCRTNQEEIFGPIVTIQSFKNESEVLAMANQSDYGLAATIWTENLGRAHRMAARVDAGIIWINCWLMRDLRTPFGGMKDSGSGREGGLEAMRFFTEPKNVCIYYGND